MQVKIEHSALYYNLICMPYMYALYVCLTANAGQDRAQRPLLQRVCAAALDVHTASASAQHHDPRRVRVGQVSGVCGLGFAS